MQSSNEDSLYDSLAKDGADGVALRVVKDDIG